MSACLYLWLSHLNSEFLGKLLDFDYFCSFQTASKIRIVKEACDRHSKLMEQCCNGQGIALCAL